MNRRNMLHSVVASIGLVSLQRSELNLARGTQCGDESGLTIRSFLFPTYPPLARQAGLQGRTSVILGVASDGHVASVSDFVGHKAFEEHLVDALKLWQFNPSLDARRLLKIEVQFSLKGERDQRCLNYRISGILPNQFTIEVNPFPDSYPASPSTVTATK